MFGRGAGFRDGSLILFGLIAAGLPLLADCGLGQSWALPLHVPIGLLLAWIGWRSSRYEPPSSSWPGWTDVSSDPWVFTGTNSGWGDWSSGGSGGFSGGDWGGFSGGASGGGGASGSW
jgi:hypothetical protein